MTFFKPTSVRRAPYVPLLSAGLSGMFGAFVGHAWSGAMSTFALINILVIGSTLIFTLVYRVNPYSAFAEFWRLPRDIKATLAELERIQKKSEIISDDKHQ